MKGNADALHEFIAYRKPFRIGDGPCLSLADILDRLREMTWAWDLCGHDAVALDRAYDMTVSKFLECPQGRRKGHSKGPDCRRCYRGFLTMMEKWRKEHPAVDPLTEEAAAAVLLQRYVIRHFRRSCLEARRSCNPARSRYTWRLPGGRIVVYMPVTLAGRRRRKWLEENIDDPDPTRPGERRRVQAIIDARLGVPRHVPLDGNEWSASPSSADGPLPLPSTNVVITAEGLARAVTEEKVENIGFLRPAIQKLCPAGLMRFLVRAFRDLRDGRYSEKRLAERSRLSRPTVTRFAGSRWRTRPESPPPDLWVNVAQVVAANDETVEAAKAAGVWPRVRKIILQAAESHTGRSHHA